MRHWLTVALAGAVGLPAATAAHGATTPSYRQVLMADYTPIPGLFLKAVSPCTSNQFAACRRTDGTVLKAVQRLQAGLSHVQVPPAVVKGDRELRAGLKSLAAALELRIRLARPSTIGPFINADANIVSALNLMDKATADLNKEDRTLRLRPA